jgi:hypothetical protein
VLANYSPSFVGALLVLLASGVGCTPPGFDAQQAVRDDAGAAGDGVVQYRLVPEDAAVGTGATRRLEVQRCAPRDDFSEEGIELTLGEADTEEGVSLTPLVPDCVPLADPTMLRSWSVNGNEGGSPHAGTVSATGSAATYTAPREIPGNNPVAVSVEIHSPGREKVLLVSNLSVVRDCPVPVCRYEGRAWQEVVIGHGDPGSTQLRVRGDATVTWTFSRMDGRHALYVPSGEVTARWTNDSCTITLSPSTHTFGPSADGGGLSVDFTANPVTYSGSGGAEWDAVQNWSCSASDRWSDPAGGQANWFSGEGTAGRDGLVLRGTSEAADRRSGWEFQAVR